MNSFMKWVGGSALALASVVAMAWTPPADPDPKQILKEARADARSGQLAHAAAKHRWYHDNVLGLMPSQSGVRMSFALSDWYELAKRYEPARRDFVAARDATAAKVKLGGYRLEPAFRDLATMNERLADWKSTRDAFADVATQDEQLARVLVDSALPALVQLDDYALAARFLDVERMQKRSSELLRTLLEPRPGRGPLIREEQASSVQYIDHQTAPMVLTLVRVGRMEEAHAALARLKKAVGDAGTTPISDAALAGRKPEGALY
jgi:hypothetical protein